MTRLSQVEKAFFNDGTARSLKAMTPAEVQSWGQQVKSRIVDSKKVKRRGTPLLDRGYRSQKRLAQSAEKIKGRKEAQRQVGYERGYALSALGRPDRTLPPPEKPDAPKNLKRGTWLPAHQAATIAGSTTAAVAGGEVLRRRNDVEKFDSTDRRKAENAAVGAATGAVAGHAVSGAGGWTIKRSLQAHRERNYDRKRHDPVWNEFRRKEGFTQPGKMFPGDRVDMRSAKGQSSVMSRYPLEIPGGRGQRLLGWKNKTVPATLLVAGPAAFAGAHSWRHTKASNVEKFVSPEQEQKRRERREAQVGLASNVLGLTAGSAALGSTMRDERLTEAARRSPNSVPGLLARAGKKIPAPIAAWNKKLGWKGQAALATGAVGLQAANIGGDVVANRVLSRSANSPQEGGAVKKNETYDSVFKRMGGIAPEITSCPQCGADCAGKAKCPKCGCKVREISKAARRFDPEADRQRRLGIYAGAGLTAGAGLAAQVPHHFEVIREGKDVVGLRAKKGRGKLALAQIAGTAAVSGVGAAAYRRGIDERNRPWN